MRRPAGCGRLGFKLVVEESVVEVVEAKMGGDKPLTTVRGDSGGLPSGNVAELTVAEPLGELVVTEARIADSSVRCLTEPCPAGDKMPRVTAVEGGCDPATPTWAVLVDGLEIGRDPSGSALAAVALFFRGVGRGAGMMG